MKTEKTFTSRVQAIVDEAIKYIEDQTKDLLKGKEETHNIELLDCAIYTDPCNDFSEMRIDKVGINEFGDVVLIDEDDNEYICYQEEFAPDIYTQVADAISLDRFDVEEV
jgi:hypothetical protein